MASNCDMEIDTTHEAFEALELVTNCNKNPTHEGFYSLAELNENILPYECRTKQWVSFIRNNSMRVVRLTINTVDGTQLYGTGFAVKHRFTGCWHIRTNHHVVGSQQDVEKCKIEFFYDTANKIGIETSYGVKLFECGKEEEEDLCYFTFDVVPPKILQLMSEPRPVPAGTFLDNIIVISHPHGGPKTITIGHELGEEVTDCGVYNTIYSARTCPSSSGGLVLDTRIYNQTSDWRYECSYTHYSGVKCKYYKEVLSETNNVNYCVW